MAPPDWQPWQTAAFLDAQRRRRPVLLLLEASWAPASAAAHADVFARADVSAAIAEQTVPVRVDVDRRPDIADRYGLGHWPSLLLLTPEGHVLTGGTRLDATLAGRIRQAVAAFDAHAMRLPAAAPVVAGGAAGGGPGSAAETGWDEHVAPGRAACLDVVRDALGAGTGAPAGAATAVAALCAFAQATVAGDPAWADLGATLVDGRAGASPGAQDDDVEARPAVRRLEDEAEWVRALARAVRLEPLPDWQDQLDRRLAALRAFRRPDGHWRPWTGATRLVLADASARACRALLAAADARHDAALATEAIEALETIAPLVYARGAGVSHVVEEGRPHGPILLDDAMLLAHALLDAAAWRDEPVYQDLAAELGETALVRLAHPSGALVDRVAALAGAGQVGRLAEPFLPLVGNAEAARLLVRLRPDDAETRERARRIVAALAADVQAAGVFAAPVGLAWIGLGTAGAVTTAW